MKSDVFLDTNILVYLFDKSERRKHKIAKKLFTDLALTANRYISIQVINEFIVIVTKKIKNPILFDQITRYIKFFQKTLTIASVDIDISFKAIELKSKYQVSYWNSLIMASALENGCSVLYTEDMQHGQIIEDRLKIVNPFCADDEVGR